MGLLRARKDRLVTADLSDEVVVYDPERKRAHSLSRLAAAVWKHCDGLTSTVGMSGLVAEEVGHHVYQPTPTTFPATCCLKCDLLLQSSFSIRQDHHLLRTNGPSLRSRLFGSAHLQPLASMELSAEGSPRAMHQWNVWAVS